MGPRWKGISVNVTYCDWIRCVNFVIFLLLDSTADLGVNIEKEWDFSKGPKWMKWMTILMKFNEAENHGKEPLRNPYVFRIRCVCYDVISVQVLFFDILGVDTIDRSQMDRI